MTAQSEDAPHRPSPVSAAPFLLAIVFAPLAALGLWLGGAWVLAAPVYGFVAAPLIDRFLALHHERIDPRVGDGALFWHKLVTWVWAPVQLAILVGLFWTAGVSQHLAAWELIAMTLSVGLVTGGVGITFAHELMHQSNRTERTLAEALMSSTLYGHFCIEHVFGHHIHVGTPRDPATARPGENIYRFLARVIPASAVSAWAIQREQLRRRGLPIWSRRNAFWRYALWSLSFIAIAYAFAGWLGVALFALQAVVAILLLECVNYVEHYGLMRRLRANGKYEPVRPHHSWNASHRLTNYILINLQRHSDHHYRPDRRFPMLESYAESAAPQLPYGYPWMILAALVPPLWFRMMDPMLARWTARFYPEEAARA